MSEQVSVRYWFSYSKEKVFVCKKALQFAHLTKKEWFINLYIFPLKTQFLFFKKDVVHQGDLYTGATINKALLPYVL